MQSSYLDLHRTKQKGQLYIEKMYYLDNIIFGNKENYNGAFNIFVLIMF